MERNHKYGMRCVVWGSVTCSKMGRVPEKALCQSLVSAKIFYIIEKAIHYPVIETLQILKNEPPPPQLFYYYKVTSNPENILTI